MLFLISIYHTYFASTNVVCFRVHLGLQFQNIRFENVIFKKRSFDKIIVSPLKLWVFNKHSFAYDFLLLFIL
jgi:hypothetical protein